MYLTRLSEFVGDVSIDRLLAWVASLVGAVSILMGVVYGLRAAWQSNAIPPELVVLSAMGLGVAGLVGGEVLWSREARAPAAGLAGMGLGTLYLSLYAAHEGYHLLGRVPTLVLLLVVTALGAVFAVRRNSQLMASLGFLCGMATPLLLSDGTGDVAQYFLYLGLLDCAAIYAAVRRRWVVLAWLSVLTTFGLRMAWEVLGAGDAPVGVASLSAALLGGLFAVGALWPGLSKRIAIPFLLAGQVALVAMIPSVGQGPVALANGFSLGAIVALMGLIHAVGVRREWWGVSLGGVVSGCLVLTVMTVRWAVTGDVGTVSLLALCLLPTGVLCAVDWVLGTRSRLIAWGVRWIALATSCSLALVAALSTGNAVLLPWVGAGAVASSWWVGLYSSPSTRDFKLLFPWPNLLCPALGVGFAIACLSLSGSAPWVILGTGAVLYAVTLAVPFAIHVPGDRGLRFAPALVGTAMVLPMLGAWQALAVDLGGVLALGMGAVAVLGVAVAGSEWMALEDGSRRAAQSVYLIVALLFASLAVPLQLEKEWLTVGWALEGAALAWASRTVRQPVVAAASLLLLAAVTVRLVINPEVLDYHIVTDPSLWNWILYGYGVPVICLLASSRWIRIPKGWWEEAVVHRGLEFAGVGVLFAMLNLQVSHAFVDEGALTLWDVTVRAQLIRTLSWAVFALGLVGLGVGARRALRWVGVTLFWLVICKVAVFDIWSLHGFSRVLLLLGIGPLFFMAAGVLQVSSRPLGEVES